MKRHDQTTGTFGNLDDLIADAQTRAHRPRITPSEAAGQAIQNLLGGLGAGVAVGALMVYAGAPYPLETGGIVAAVCAGGIMFLRSIADEASDVRRLRTIQATAKRAVEERSKRLALALDELDALEAALNDEQRAHADTKHLLSLSRVEIAQLRDQLSKRTTYVAPAQAAPQVVTDANRLLSNYYSTGEWTSRRKATEAPLSWTAERYRAACDILRDAGVIVSRNTRTDVTPKDLPTATEKLNTYLLWVDTNRPPVDAYVEEDNDDYDR